jgi:chromosome segregation ATPase
MKKIEAIEIKLTAERSKNDAMNEELETLKTLKGSLETQLESALEKVNSNKNENNEVEQKGQMEALEKIISDKDSEIVDIKLKVIRLETENKTLKDKLKDLEDIPQTSGTGKDLEKTREFLKRKQEECKNLERWRQRNMKVILRKLT